MSYGSDKGGLFVDTGLLRDHVSKLQQEKKKALSLYENVAAMKALSKPEEAYRYDPILRDINELIEYFTRMANALAYTEDEAVQLGHDIARIIEEGTDETKAKVKREILL